MKLYCSPSSPYVRKARVVLREKKILEQVAEVMVVSAESGPELLSVNPLSKIPALARPDASPLFDSPVICEYLDSLPSERPPLFPDKGEERWQALRYQALGDGMIDAAFNIVMENRREPHLRSSFWIDRWTSAILRSLDLLESEADRLIPALKDGKLTIGTVTLGAALGYLDFRLGHLKWPSCRPQLEQLSRHLMQWSSMQDTIPQDAA